MAQTRRRTSNTQGPVADLIDAIGASQEAKRKANHDLKMHILKLKAASQIRQQEGQAKFNTPEQQFLKRRAMEENPLAQIMLPTEENPTNEIDTPSEEVVQNNQGLYEAKPINEDRKNQFVMAKFQKMMEAADRGEGPRPSALAAKIVGRMRERMNKKLGYGADNNNASILKKRLDYLENNAESTPENDALLEETRQEYEQAIGIKRGQGNTGAPKQDPVESVKTDDFSYLWK